LLDHLRADDPAAWDRLVVLYAPLVIRWCRRWNLADQDCADVVQDVFQAVAVHLHSFRRERSGDTFRGWIRTIARNKMHDHYRRMGHDPQGVGGTEAQVRLGNIPEDLTSYDEEANDERDLLTRALELVRGEFESNTWCAFWGMAVDGKPASEVGMELGMSAGAVRVAKSRVLRRLREELGDL
jgi:RNA polymerase sigma-70 factor (ECF subfamily)